MPRQGLLPGGEPAAEVKRSTLPNSGFHDEAIAGSQSQVRGREKKQRGRGKSGNARSETAHGLQNESRNVRTETTASVAKKPQTRQDLQSLQVAATACITSKEDWDIPLSHQNNSTNTILDNDRLFPWMNEECRAFPEPLDARAYSKVLTQMLILWAAANGHDTLMASLLENYARHLAFTNFYSQTPLSLAAENGHEGIVKLLLNADDVGLNSPDLDGQTPLAWAAFNGHSAVVQLFLGRDDLEANSKDVEGNTPLSWAAANGHEMIAASLLERYDVEVNNANHQGRTPLSLAAENGHECIVRLLLVWERDEHSEGAKECDYTLTEIPDLRKPLEL